MLVLFPKAGYLLFWGPLFGDYPPLVLSHPLLDLARRQGLGLGKKGGGEFGERRGKKGRSEEKGGEGWSKEEKGS